MAGLEEYNYTTHSLRHTVAAQLYMNNVDLLVIKEILGHSSITTTEIYTTELDCQVDLILRSLAFYKYTYEFIYPRRKENRSLEENLRISLVRDTYEQIFTQYTDSKYNYKKLVNEEFLNENYKEIV